jgi:predicted esterase
MSISFSRAVARAAVVCLVTATSLGAAASTLGGSNASAATTEASAHSSELLGATFDRETRGHYASTPSKLRSAGHDLLAYPPSPSAAAHPTTVIYLHGVHGRAENGCPWFHGGASELGWLVCPEAASREPNGTASWGGDVVEQGIVVARALRAAEEQGASSEPGVAVGFSQGAYVALDLVKTHQARFRGLLLIAAPEAHPSAQKLREAGVLRVALAAGRQDAAYAPLTLDAQRLQREGIEARFYDLGNVGHTYATEETSTLREAIAWAGGIRE